ncbi:hypothetical protein Plhal304r1_c011g0041581 [Plasmopara halstedii]
MVWKRYYGVYDRKKSLRLLSETNSAISVDLDIVMSSTMVEIEKCFEPLIRVEGGVGHR